MEELKARMSALSLNTNSTDSLLARIARLPIDIHYWDYLEPLDNRVAQAECRRKRQHSALLVEE